MKEVRPSTWILLGVLALFIFAPMFFIDVDGLKGVLNQQGGNTIHPTDTTRSNTPASNKAPAANAGNEAPSNDAPELPANNDPETVE